MLGARVASTPIGSALIHEQHRTDNRCLMPFDFASLRLTGTHLDRARRLRAETGERLDVILVRLGLISEAGLAAAYAAHAGVPQADLSRLPDAPLLRERIKLAFLRDARAVPLAEDGDALIIAFADPTDAELLAACAFAAKRRIIAQVAPASDIERALDRIYGEPATLPVAAELDIDAAGAEDTERLRDLASDAPIIRLVNRWVTAAVEAHASDIHIEPGEAGLLVRFRLDGVLVEQETQPLALHAAVVSRLKIMARLDIAERRLTQDGRIGIAVRGRETDIRISIIPTVRGESVVLRILERGGVTLDFAALGFDPASLARYLSVLERPHGVVLATGPTGSGKTTTLYTSLQRLRRPDSKILTVEDPVEYRLDGVNHTQVRPQIGLDFAATLRAFLRHDPDIIMAGEIRDGETARIAVQAALTGHLMLSSLHTNNAAGNMTSWQEAAPMPAPTAIAYSAANRPASIAQGSVVLGFG